MPDTPAASPPPSPPAGGGAAGFPTPPGPAIGAAVPPGAPAASGTPAISSLPALQTQSPDEKPAGATKSNTELLTYGLIGALVLVVVVAGLLILNSTAHQAETGAGSKDLQIQRLCSANPKVREKAAATIIRNGPKMVFAAFEGVIQVQDQYTCAVNQAAIDELASAGTSLVPVLIEGLQSSSLKVRLGSACTLCSMGSKAKGAVSSLRDAVLDENPLVCQYAIATLSSIGPDAASASRVLAAMTTHPDRTTRLKAIEALEAIGPAAADAAFPLWLAKGDANPDIRRAATAALKTVDPQNTADQAAQTGEEDIRGHLKSLASKDPAKQIEAAGALGQMGPRALPGMSLLVARVRSANPEVRAAAIRALGEIGSEAAFMVPALENLSKDKNSDSGARSAAREAVGRLKPLLAKTSRRAKEE